MYYCGIDLSSRTSHICVIDDNLNIVVQKKVPNDLDEIKKLLRPYHVEIKIVVESTFNWYWLVDGLMDDGYNVCLAHTLGLYMITGAKVKTDRRDAFALAKLLKAGVIPKAYIYPKEDRAARDLLRRRTTIVRLRAGEYGSIRRMLLRHGILKHTRHSMTKLTDEALEAWFDHPMVCMHAKQELERISLYSTQISKLEKTIEAEAKQRPEYALLMGIAGIRRILGMTIYYESGNMDRFKSGRHYSSYVRVVPGIAQSGGVFKRGKNSKQGNAYLKWAFSQAATYAVRYYPKIRRCFQRQCDRHRGKGSKLIAYNIIAHKLALAAFHVLKNGVSYKEELIFGR